MQQAVAQVVMVSPAQCWQCNCLIEPGAELRIRSVKTVVHTDVYGQPQSYSYERVRLCVACDEDMATEERREQTQQARQGSWLWSCLGSLWMVGLLLSLHLPWMIVAGVTIGLTYAGVLGRTILTLVIAENMIEYCIGKTATLALAGPLTASVIALMLVSKYGWRVPHRTQRRAVQRNAILAKES